MTNPTYLTDYELGSLKTALTFLKLNPLPIEERELLISVLRFIFNTHSVLQSGVLRIKGIYTMPKFATTQLQEISQTNLTYIHDLALGLELYNAFAAAGLKPEKLL